MDFRTSKTPLGGRYKLIEQLGAGGFGRTFIAEDIHLPGHPRCVLKRLQPQFTNDASLQTAKRLFNTEAQVLYQLGEHDQIPRLLAHFEQDHQFYLAQELIVGHPLTEEFFFKKLWTEAQVIALLLDLLEVLTFVHQQHVIHRDIKPANLIRRSRDQQIVLIDFGAVKQVSTPLMPSSSGTTQTIAIGTPGYMPNEQLAGSPRFSSDVYAVGMLGIQALTGLSPQSLRDDPQTGEIQWQQYAPQVTPALASVLDQMIRYDFRMRYPTAAEALEAVRQIPIPDSAPAPHPGELVQLFSRISTVQWNNNLPSSSPNPSSLLSTRWVTWHSKVTPLKQLKQRLVLLPLAGLSAIASLFITQSSMDRSSSQSAPIPEPTSDVTTLMTQADQARRRSQFQRALDLYQQAIALNPKIPEVHWGRCYSLNALEKFADAIVACDAALQLKPNDAQALLSKGYALDQQQHNQQALTLYEQAIQQKPDFPEAWNNKGSALLHLKRPTEALSAFEIATRLKPDFAEAWSNRGAALWNLRRFEAAIASVNQALQLQPNSSTALNLQRQMHHQLRRSPQSSPTLK